MLKQIRQVIKEQVEYRQLIYQLAVFELRGQHQNNFLGSFWQFLSPAIQIGIYWFVFGIGLRGGADINGTPFFLWLVLGIIPWFFIAPSITQASSSVYQKVSLVSKMNFPVSVLPTIRIISNSQQFFIMLGILFVITLLYGVKPSLYLIQIIYYICCMFIFLIAFGLITSTLATLARDFQVFLQSIIRMLFYLTPILWDTSLLVNSFGEKGQLIENILKLNPFYYIVEGFRDAFLGRAWFFDDMIYTLYFWIITFTILYFGSKLHIRFRNNFMDYL
ncbi:teichoic acid transport system permease protein [Gracilibacillus halotolerans]|uniref:Transport permease protein n=1 Tax=Gracilibacillus halotolerans TaxID=74386 RepID=A0A841RHE2_9BACI|nr:ABC transporter permease [Gracilibacillus halotolerans]MBB6513590.1 teichoic acid transport system permease protein [Gracilibacillus halotolerans]